MPDAEPSAKSIFWNAHELDAVAREAYLAASCGSDAELRARVERLLAAEGRSDSFLAPPLGGIALEDPAPAYPIGAEIGPYKLLEQIGEGGMGIVYMAAQREPVQRTVALKIIKPGMDTRACIARFKAERQALALMNHPNIAKIYDGGATGDVRWAFQTDTRRGEHGTTGQAEEIVGGVSAPGRQPEKANVHIGRPYFVMELVRGIPITDFCDEHQLGIRERLAIFVHVCRAVQNAHQKGVIHRDLKPTNVLVELHDVVPVPKIIDFGVAKALHGPLTERTLHTGFHQLIGTPLYMSPEQAELSGLDVDTRSDVYSLGVLIYELLTGATPFDRDTLQRVGYDEMRRMIREDDPPRPSGRVSTLAARCGVDPRKLTTALHGDLDWIVMKCLEKDRTRRYETAADLARDIERYMADEPVQARPPSVAYRARKFIRKHRVGVAAAAAILLTTTLAGVLAGVGFAQAVRERDATAAALDRATKNLHSACSLVDHVISPTYYTIRLTPGVEELHFRMVDETLQFYRKAYKEAPRDPVIRWGLMSAIMRGQDRILISGGDPTAECWEAIELLRALVAEYPKNKRYQNDFAWAHWKVAEYYQSVGRYAEAGAFHAEAIRHARREPHPSAPGALEARAAYHLNQAFCTGRLGNHAQAEIQFREGLAFDADPYDECVARQRFADLLMQMGRFDEARAELQQAERLAETLSQDSVASQSHPSARRTRLDVVSTWQAVHAMRTGDLPLAQERIRRAINEMEAVHAALPHVFWCKYFLGWSYYTQAEIHALAGRFDDAARAAERAISHWDRDRPIDRYNATTAHWLLGELLHRQGKFAEAESHFALAAQGLAARADELLAEPHSNERLICFLSNCVSEKFRDPARAAAIAERLLARADTNGPMWLYLGLARYRAGDWPGAEQALQESIRVRNGGDALDWLLLAAIEHKAGDKASARQQYARAQQAIAEGKPVFYGHIGTQGFLRLADEVEQLINKTTKDRQPSLEFDTEYVTMKILL